VALLFISYGVVLFYPFLTSRDVSITNKWDGPAAMGFIRSFNEDMMLEGPRILLGDTYQPRSSGITPSDVQVPTNTFWRISYALAGKLVAPENILDLLTCIGFIFTGIASFLLMRYLKAPPLILVTGTLLLAFLQPLQRIIPGHLGLGLYFMPLLTIVACMYAAERKTFLSLVIFVCVLVANFLWNEYYGFFGFIFCGLVFIGFYFSNTTPSFPRHTRTVSFLAAAVLFVILMAAFYPSTIGQRLVSLMSVTHEAGMLATGRDWNDFLRHSNIAPGTLYSLTPIFSKSEKSLYGIGFWLPFFVIFFLCTLIAKPAGSGRFRSLARYAVVVGAITIIALFGISATHPLSLAHVTYKVAPYLRCGDRALLYFTLGALLIFFLISIELWRRFEHEPGRARYVFPVVYLAAFMLVANDMKIERPFFFPQLQLEGGQTYRPLNSLGYGLLVELPFGTDDEFYNYHYLHHYTFHGKPMLNCWTFPEPAATKLRGVAKILNPMNEESVEWLKQHNIRYVVVNKPEAGDPLYFLHSGGLKRLYEDSERAVFETQNIEPGNISLLKAYFAGTMLFPKQFDAEHETSSN